jgi:broad specificity phosphatase PhoE
MRILEVRRHTIRDLSSPHISQEGVDLARRVGQGMGKFDRVVTSTLPRAFETAIAMGYTVDEQIEQLSMMGEEVQAVIQWNAGYTAWAKAATNNAVVGLYTQALAELWRSRVRSLPENGRALIISHGGIVEAGTIGCLPTSPLYGHTACSYCEGVRLTFDGEAVVNLEILRVEQPSI